MRLRQLTAAAVLLAAVAGSATAPRDTAGEFAADLARRELSRLVLVLAQAPERKWPTIRNMIKTQRAILRSLAAERG